MLDNRECTAEVGGGLDAATLRAPVIQGWRMAAAGFNRRSGSHIKHFAMKSTKWSSSAFKTCCSVFVPGRRRLPFELATILGCPKESELDTQQSASSS